MADASRSADPPQAASDSSRDPDDPNWPRPVVGALADERTELPVPDEQAFSPDYRPWRTVKLADGSETAVYLALDTVPQWTDPPTGVAAGSDDAQLPVPAMPYISATTKPRPQPPSNGLRVSNVSSFRVGARRDIRSFLPTPEQ